MMLYRFLLHLLFPEKCVLCRRMLRMEQLDLCKTCREQSPYYRNRKTKLQFLDSFTAVWYYEKNVRKSLHRYKFGRARHYAPAYGRLLAMILQNHGPKDFDLLTWVPVSRLRRLTRGYDQVQLLAEEMGTALEIEPVALLKKIRHNRPQSGIRGDAQRRANVLGAYREIDCEAIAGKRILLLDDILTTGATAGECARVLKIAGAKEVHCAVIAAARK